MLIMLDSPAACWSHIEDLVEYTYGEAICETGARTQLAAVAGPIVEAALREAWRETYGVEVALISETVFDSVIPELMITSLYWALWTTTIDRIDGDAIVEAAGLTDELRAHAERTDAAYAAVRVG